MAGKSHERLESADDALGRITQPGDVVLYYSGDQAALAFGSVVRIYERTYEPCCMGREVKEVRFIVTPNRASGRESNVGQKLLVKWEGRL